MFSLPQYTWDKDRELCQKCKHFREEPRKHPLYGSSPVMLCVKNPYKGRRGIGTCIDNRTRGPCKDGKLFESAEDSPITPSPVLKANRAAVNPLRQPNEVISIS